MHLWSPLAPAAHIAPPALQLAGSEEAETWAFLQTHFAADGRRFLLERLGFAEVLPSAPEAEATAEGAAEAEASLAAGMAAGDAAALGAVGEGMAQLSLDQQQQQQQQQQALAEQLLNDDGADFFEQSPVTGEGMRRGGCTIHAFDP